MKTSIDFSKSLWGAFRCAGIRSDDCPSGQTRESYEFARCNR
jgi:hypothetical protein